MKKTFHTSLTLKTRNNYLKKYMFFKFIVISDYDKGFIDKK